MNIDQILDSLQSKGYDKQERVYKELFAEQNEMLVSFEKDNVFIIKLNDDAVAILNDEDYGYVLNVEDFENSTYNK
jgi:predicted regulator of Ras-like GTPase activity (Roadblock/LC7/MglB family)